MHSLCGNVNSKIMFKNFDIHIENNYPRGGGGV